MKTQLELTKPLSKLRRITAICAVCLFASVASADVRILLDISQSMAINDPQNNRTEALSLLVDTLPEGEKAGVWTFGQFVNLLVPHEEVDNSWRNTAMSRLQSQQPLALRTNLGRALEEASYDFLFSTYPGSVDVVVVTDGQVDIAPNTAVNRIERDRILSQIVPRYAAANARIHTIAVSDEADHALLMQLSERTGGQYQRVDDADNMSRALMSLASEVSPMTQLKMEQQSFSVDDSIRELTVLMYHDEGAVSLLSPSGETTSAVRPSTQRWRVGNGFTQVTIQNPMQGLWRVEGDLKGSSNIRVISDINVRWESPTSSAVARGSLIQLEAMLVDRQGNSIAEDLAPLVSADLRVNGARVPAQIQGDKILARVVPQENLEAVSVELEIDGGTFSRLMNRQVRFVDPYISEVLLTDAGYEWRLYPNRFLSDVESMMASATVDYMGNIESEPFVQAPAGYWVWTLPMSASPGVYNIRLEGQMTQTNQMTMLPSESIQLSMPPTGRTANAMVPQMNAAAPQVPEMPIEQAPLEMPMTDSSPAFVKDPMPEFAELQADLVVSAEELSPDDEWTEEPINEPSSEEGSSIDLLTYLLLSIPGILVLGLAYLFYRRLEQKASSSAAEDELMLGGDEFAGLDDINNLAPDADLDLGGVDDFEEGGLAPAPVIDDVFDEDLPTPEQTEAPTPAAETVLETADSAAEQQSEEATVDSDEELFDISSIDDDLADLDLALDGDDPFADDDEKA